MGTGDSVEKRFVAAQEQALLLNAELPTDVMLKGDGSIWITTHGNEGIRWRQITQEQVIKIIYQAIRRGEQLVSV